MNNPNQQQTIEVLANIKINELIEAEKAKYVPQPVKNKSFVSDTVLRKNLLTALSKGYTPLEVEVTGKKPMPPMVVLAGGQSANSKKEEITRMVQNGAHLIVVNGMHDIVIKEWGLIPTFAIIVDPQRKHAKYWANPHPDVTYILSSQVDDELHDNVAGVKDNVRLFHVMYNKGEKDVLDIYKSITGIDYRLIRCGTTGGLASLTTTYQQGYRQFYLFGFDSCVDSVYNPEVYVFSDYAGTSHHAYENNIKPLKVASVGGSEFYITDWQYIQVIDFLGTIEKLTGSEYFIQEGGFLAASYASYMRKKTSEETQGQAMHIAGQLQQQDSQRRLQQLGILLRKPEPQEDVNSQAAEVPEQFQLSDVDLGSLLPDLQENNE